MIIFLYGQDTYRSRQKLTEIIESYKKIHKSGLNLRYVEGGDFNFEDAKNETQTISMFDEKKLIIFKNVLDRLKEEDKALDFFKKFIDSKDTIVIYEEKEADKRLSLVKFFGKEAKVQEFNLLDAPKLKSWAKGQIEAYGGKIDLPAMEKLVEYVGSDLWWMKNEIEKLVNYKNGKAIGVADVELLVKPKIEPEIFKTIDAIAFNSKWSGKKQALKLLHDHLEKGDHPLYLLSMINFQFRNLLIIKDLMEKNVPYYSIPKITKMHSFVVKKTYEQAGKFTFQELKKIYQKIFQVDLSIKTGKINPTAALDFLIVSI
ncbi:MAG: DNA polymerase III subunit delta [Candidatus Nealsonbacteria bacterium]|nr:DNA polymerase III subunit delta [Candidatus Nealsonbacteria bacterium]